MILVLTVAVQVVGYGYRFVIVLFSRIRHANCFYLARREIAILGILPAHFKPKFSYAFIQKHFTCTFLLDQ